MSYLYNSHIRPIAISIITNNDKILVYKREDEITNNSFYRLVGGCIEFGETSKEALAREFNEELSQQLVNIKLLTAFESIFTFNGRKLHEIVFLFNSEFENQSIYNKKVLKGCEGEREFDALWVPKDDFITQKKLIYPVEIIDYL